MVTHDHAEVHAKPAPQLASLEFMVGTLSGEGWYHDPSRRYTKEVSAGWVAGGHHLLVEMSAVYPLHDGVSDAHSVAMIVSADKDNGALISRVYTDGGDVIDYRPVATPEGLCFDDRVPHGMKAKRARKLLARTESGYEETLQVDRGDGEFVDWSKIRLERREP